MWHRSVCLALVVSLSAPCAIAAVPGLPPLPPLPVLLKKAKASVGSKSKAVAEAARPAVHDEYEFSKPVGQVEEQVAPVAQAPSSPPLTPPLPAPLPLAESAALAAAPASAEPQVSKNEPSPVSVAKPREALEPTPVVSLPKAVPAVDSISSAATPLLEPVKPALAAVEPLVAPPTVEPGASAAALKASGQGATASSLIQAEGYYLPLSCVEFDNSADSVEYQVKKGGLIERKAAPPEKKLATFAVSPGESLRATLKRWAAPDYAFLWEASPEVDFTFRTAAQFGKDRTTAVKTLMDAVRGTVSLQLSIYNKNNVWVVRGEIPDTLCP